MRTYITFVAGLCAGVALAWFAVYDFDRADAVPPVVSQASAPDDPSAPLDEPSAAARQPPEPDAFWQPGIWNWIETAARQRYDMTDFRDLAVTDEVWSEQELKWLKISHESSSSFDMLRTASAHQDLFCFAGLADNGDFVLERWRLEPMTLPLGGGFGQPSTPEGLVPKRFRKAEIARDRSADEVMAVEFDLEERFILVLVKKDGVWELRRYDNQVGAVPVALMSSSSDPLLSEMHHMQKFNHTAYGRVWILQSDAVGSFRIALLDAMNDGQFDGSPVQGDLSYFEYLGLDEADLMPLLSP